MIQVSNYAFNSQILWPWPWCVNGGEDTVKGRYIQFIWKVVVKIWCFWLVGGVTVGSMSDEVVFLSGRN